MNTCGLVILSIVCDWATKATTVWLVTRSLINNPLSDFLLGFIVACRSALICWYHQLLKAAMVMMKQGMDVHCVFANRSRQLRRESLIGYKKRRWRVWNKGVVVQIDNVEYGRPAMKKKSKKSIEYQRHHWKSVNLKVTFNSLLQHLRLLEMISQTMGHEVMCMDMKDITILSLKRSIKVFFFLVYSNFCNMWCGTLKSICVRMTKLSKSIWKG